MIPPPSFLSTDNSENIADRPQLDQFNADPESLRHQRRPTTIIRARRHLDAIMESASGLKMFLEGPTRFLDGDIVEASVVFEDTLMKHLTDVVVGTL